MEGNKSSRLCSLVKRQDGGSTVDIGTWAAVEIRAWVAAEVPTVLGKLSGVVSCTGN